MIDSATISAELREELRAPMSEPIDPRDPRLRAWAAFLRAHARIVRALEQELQDETGMALTDYDVLVQLAITDGRRLRMSELADRLLLSRSGATRLVDRLVAAGLVERVTCDADRRGQWASLTDAGYERLKEASPTHLRGVAEHFVDRLDGAEIAALERALERLG
jgi:DNA-binding MarR family transcriptional regulator